jgi:uncharacterized membrane protein
MYKNILVKREENLLTKNWIIVVLLIIGTTLLYSYNLELRSYTNDELGTILTGNMNLNDLWNTVRSIDIHPPTHYIIIHYLIQLFGMNVWILRFSSIIPILILIPVLYSNLSKKFSKSIAIQSILLIILSPNILYYSRMVRYYSWALLFAIVSIILFIKLLESLNPKNSMVFILSTALLFYFQYLTFFLVVIAEILFWVIIHVKNYPAGKNKELKKWLAIIVCIFLLILPFLISVTINQFSTQFSINQKLSSSNSSIGFNLTGMILAFLYPLYSITFSQNFFPWEIIYTIPVLAITIFILFNVKNIFANNKNYLVFVLVFIILPLMLTAFLMSRTKISMAFAQSCVYTLFIVPIILVLYSISIQSIKSKYLQKSIYYILLLFNIISIISYYNYHTALCWDPNWKEIAIYLEHKTNSSDIIVANNPHHLIIKTSYLSYYLKRPTIDVLEDLPEITNNTYSQNCKKIVNMIVNKKINSIWVVKIIRLPGEVTYIEKVLAENGYKLTTKKGFWEIDKSTINYKKYLSLLSFLNYNSAPLNKYMVEVMYYKNK